MKHYIFTLIAVFSITFYSKAQIAIGKPAPATDAILDFGTDGNKGIILPYVTALTSATVPGTLYYDVATSKVKFRLKNNIDKDLSVKAITPGAGFVPTTEGYSTLKENGITNGTIIGADATNAPGVLVLDSKLKVLVLPNVTSFSNVGGPAPGTIVFDTTKNMLCVYDGEKWAFWGKKNVITP